MNQMTELPSNLVRKDGENENLLRARQALVDVVDATRAKVRETTGLEMNRSWVAPVVAGAAGLALALWLRKRRG